MILTEYTKLYDKNGNVRNNKKRAVSLVLIKCDNCENIFEKNKNESEKSFKTWNGYYCVECVKKLAKERLVKAGTQYLKNRTKEEKIEHAKIGGIACRDSGNLDTKSFTTDRWNSMSEEEKRNQVIRASNALQEKLKDPDERIKHFNKVYKNSRIGYISKGQEEVYKFVESYGFKIEQPVLNLHVDFLNESEKLIIEYNGDFFHCNPRIWEKDDFNKCINMKAGEKWEQDRKRRFFLKDLGYKILVIWEYEWKHNCESALEKIYRFIKNKGN